MEHKKETLELSTYILQFFVTSLYKILSSWCTLLVSFSLYSKLYEEIDEMKRVLDERQHADLKDPACVLWRKPTNIFNTLIRIVFFRRLDLNIVFGTQMQVFSSGEYCKVESYKGRFTGTKTDGEEYKQDKEFNGNKEMPYVSDMESEISSLQFIENSRSFSESSSDHNSHTIQRDSLVEHQTPLCKNKAGDQHDDVYFPESCAESGNDLGDFYDLHSNENPQLCNLGILSENKKGTHVLNNLSNKTSNALTTPVPVSENALTETQTEPNISGLHCMEQNSFVKSEGMESPVSMATIREECAVLPECLLLAAEKSRDKHTKPEIRCIAVNHLLTENRLVRQKKDRMDNIVESNNKVKDCPKDHSFVSTTDPLSSVWKCLSVNTVSDRLRECTVLMMRGVHQQSPGEPASDLMKREWNRLSTFALCDTVAGVFVTSLANGGFYFLADNGGGVSMGLKVKCAFCNTVIDIAQFVKTNVMDVHRKSSPLCRFVLGEATGNVSIADLANATGERFLSNYSGSMTESATALRCSIQHAAAKNQKRERGHTDDIATDAEQQAVERPAPSFLNFQDRASNLGASALSNSSLTLPPPLSKQAAAFGQQPAHTAKFAGETVADARPSQNIIVASAPLPTAGSAPFQTATITSPARDSAVAASANQQSRDGCAGADASSNTAAAVSQGERGQGRETAGSAGRSSNAQERQTVTYEDLGIISQKPKRPDMAVIQTRINTFTAWIHEQTHPKKEMAEAGFYYTGHEDLVRCFHCKGGLKTWESSDKPWVEHARWFPRCPFLKLCKGQRFIDAVQKLNDPNTRPTISQEAVVREMKRIEEEERQNLSPDIVLFNNLPARPLLSNEAPEIAALRIDAKVTEASMNELAEQLADENEEIRSSTTCKMCQTYEVNVLFLPCGHLVACAQCAPALTTCAMCRQPVKGSVRVHLDDNKLDSEQEMGSTHPDPNSHSAA